MEESMRKEEFFSITEAYACMEMLPGQLSTIVATYSNQIKEETARHDGAMQAIVNTFNTKKQNIETQKQKDYKEAEEAKNTIFGQLNGLKEKMQLSDSHYSEAVKDLPGKDPQVSPAIGAGLMRVYNQVVMKRNDATQKFEDAYANLVKQEGNIYSDKIREADHTHDIQLSTATEEYSNSVDHENKKTSENHTTILETAKKTIEGLNPVRLKEMYEQLLLNDPVVKNYETAKEIPEAVGMGFLKIDLDYWYTDQSNKPVVDLIRDYFSFAVRNVDGHTMIMVPFGQTFTDPKINKLILFDSSSRSLALEYIRALEMRLFMIIPCGKLRVTMIDPVDSGSNFSMFSCLGDDDERIISTRIWCDPKRIKERLSLLINQIEHVNQDCLRNEFEDIVAYNKHVGKNAEPLQALFVADFPRHFDFEACEMLEKIVSIGPKCGIYTFLAGSTEDIKASKFDIKGISQAIQNFNYINKNIKYPFNKMEHNLQPISLPSKDEQTEILNVLINGIKTSDRIIIYFDEIADQLTTHKEKWFKFNDANGIDIPIGLEGASRTVQIHLGGELITQHHALISGTIGSGKSTLLHTIIMSLLLKYSPEDVQIYLLDFKRGVEFKVYAESKLPNFRVISLDTEPEFGLAVLRYLEQEQEERAQEFHDKNCDNIERYNEIAEADLHDDIYKLPRIVLIIDEFHEMFSNSDSSISKECERLLEQIVRQGRAMGIHVILASQTLPDNLSRIYGQIMNRVALQSTASSAQYILDSDNEAVNTLVNVDPGKGVFNDGGGNRDANHPFRVAYFTEETQRDLLKEIREQQELCMSEGMFGNQEFEKPRLLLSTIQDDNDNPLNIFVETGAMPKRLEFGCPLYLGEEIAMVNDFSIRLTSRRAQNLLILGSDSKRASVLYGFSAMSILFNAYVRSENHVLPERPLITFFDFGKNSNMGRRVSKNSIDIMNELSARFPFAIRIFGKDSLMDGIEMLQSEYEQNETMLNNHYIIFAGLNRARRLLDNDSAYSMPPKKIFENLVKKGPEKGYNYIIWANEPGSFCNFYGDLIPEFDYRLVYDLKEEEYEQVIKSSSMDTAYGNNVISYNPDEDNKKVRIYSMPLAGWFTKFMDRIEGVSWSSEEESYSEGEFEDDF